MYNDLIEVFMVVADCGSFTKASKKLFCSTVSIMKQMNNLEERLEVKLFDRTTQGIILTHAGQSIYKDAKEIIILSNKAIKKAKHISNNEKKVIRIGTSLMRPCKPLTDLLSIVDFNSLPFQIEIVPFDDLNLPKAFSMIEKEIDCFISPFGRTKWLEKFNVHFLGEYRCCIMTPKNHRLANKDIITWKDLDHEFIFLVKQGESVVLDHIRERIKKHHPLINIIDSNDFFTLNTFNNCVKMNYLIEAIETWENIHPGLVTKPVEWNYIIPYGIIYSLTPSKNIIEFIDYIENIISSQHTSRL